MNQQRINRIVDDLEQLGNCRIALHRRGRAEYFGVQLEYDPSRRQLYWVAFLFFEGGRKEQVAEGGVSWDADKTLEFAVVDQVQVLEAQIRLATPFSEASASQQLAALPISMN